jgi:hypothetical protein
MIPRSGWGRAARERANGAPEGAHVESHKLATFMGRI